MRVPGTRSWYFYNILLQVCVVIFQNRYAALRSDPSPPQYSVYPVDWKPDNTYRPASKPAKDYPFTLDPFQKQAIQYIERNESVLVSAHTSAGKVCFCAAGWL